MPYYTPASRMWEFCLFLIYTTLGVFCIFYFSHSGICTIVLHHGFDFHFPDDQWCWAFFLHAYYPLLQSTCFGYFANFLLYSAFSLLIYRSSYIFWICLFFMWYKYLPLCGLSFYYIAMLFSSFSKYSSLILLQYKCFGWCSLCPI